MDEKKSLDEEGFINPDADGASYQVKAQNKSEVWCRSGLNLTGNNCGDEFLTRTEPSVTVSGCMSLSTL